MVSSYHARSHAKINLTLEIIDKLPNGYHALRSVMMQLPHLYDEIDVDIDEVSTGIMITCDDPAVPTDEKNICHKVVQKFFERTGRSVGMKIALKKHIPVAAGMGGGSSNGACVLHVLNEHFDHILTHEDMIDLSASVGKDIPFFFAKKDCALIEGMGEVITEEMIAPDLHILVVNPGIAVSTPWAFGELARHLWFMTDIDRTDRSRMMMKAMCENAHVAQYIYNDFEPAIFAAYPVIAEIKQAMVAFGAQNALMSGSGSTVFGIFETENDLFMAKEKIQKRFSDFFVAIG